MSESTVLLSIADPAIYGRGRAILADLTTGRLTAADVTARLGQPKQGLTLARPEGGVAVVPLFGTMFRGSNFLTAMGLATATDQVAGLLRQLAVDEEVGGVVVAVDSGGGEAIGVEELAATVRQVRQAKPVWAAVVGSAFSAAYWIATAAEQIIVTPSGMVGSIGALAYHVDESKALEGAGIKVTLVTSSRWKALNNPYEPATAEGLAEMQALVDDYGGRFERDVARGRGVSVDRVRADFGQGRVFTTQPAIRKGMIDREGTRETAIRAMQLRVKTGKPLGATAAGYLGAPAAVLGLSDDDRRRRLAMHFTLDGKHDEAERLRRRLRLAAR